MNEQNMLKPAAIGGVLIGVLSAIPFISCGCCIWTIGGGTLAAYLYVKESATMVNLGQGVLLGLFAGIIGTAVYTLFQLPLLLMSPESRIEFVEQIQAFMDQWPGIPQENREEFMELTAREGFVTFLFVSSLFFQLIANCLLSILGGALGVAIFEKRKNSGPVQEPPSYLPPSDSSN